MRQRLGVAGASDSAARRQPHLLVQLPGVQDTTKDRDILGRTATLEVRVVERPGQGGRGAIRPGAFWL